MPRWKSRALSHALDFPTRNQLASPAQPQSQKRREQLSVPLAAQIPLQKARLDYLTGDFWPLVKIVRDFSAR